MINVKLQKQLIILAKRRKQLYLEFSNAKLTLDFASQTIHSCFIVLCSVVFVGHNFCAFLFHIYTYKIKFFRKLFNTRIILRVQCSRKLSTVQVIYYR